MIPDEIGMTADEVRELLSVAAGYDLRTVGQSDVDAWVLALQDLRIPRLSLGECVDAVILHYQTSTDRIMPAHILDRVRRERQAALAAVMPAHPAGPANYDQRVHGLWGTALAEAGSRMAANRSAVLAHPDLARRLTEPPLNFPKPEQWRGNIGPDTFGGEHNDSARREALAELVDEATRRATEPVT
jgi:hypothetical protein